MSPSSNSSPIAVENLTKFYGPIRGVEDISFSVDKGEIHGFLGPNGAGKTTTIRVLVGLLSPTAGSASILGNPAGSVEAKSLIGYLPANYTLYSHYRVGEYLNYLATLRGDAPLLDELVTRFDLDLTRKTKELSTGNRQKVSIVQGLMHDPEVVIADEPTSGLDPLMQAEFEKVIQEFSKRGKTIFVSSHILAEVQDICTKVTVVREGRLVNSGRVDQLLEQVPRKAVVKQLTGMTADSLASELDAQVGDDNHGRLILYYTYPNKEFVRRISAISAVEDFFLPEPSLEEYFLPLYQREPEE